MTEHEIKEIREKAEQTVRAVDHKNESIHMSIGRIYSDQRTILALLDEIKRLEARFDAAMLMADNHAMGRVNNSEKSAEWEESFHQAKALEKAAIEKWQRYKNERDQLRAENTRLKQRIQDDSRGDF